MPVTYRVLISGFSAAERVELDGCFVSRSLIAYQRVDTLADADLVIVDADDPPTLERAVRLLQPRSVLFIGHHAPEIGRWRMARPVRAAVALGVLDELVATEKPRPHAFADNFLSLVRPPADDGLSFAGFSLRERQAVAPVHPPTAPVIIAVPTDPPRLTEPVAVTLVPPMPAAPLPAATSPAAPATVSNGEHRTFPPIDLGAVDAALESAWPVLPRLPRTESSEGDRRSAKASVRAAVRRAQRTGRAGPSGGLAAALVVEADAPVRLLLGELLGSFGFQPVSVTSVADAEKALRERAFTVVFVGAVDDAGGEAAGIELCHRIKQDALGLPAEAPKVVMLWPRSRPADRVRARLAGCDHFVTGPASRGVVAHALEAVGVEMPQDPRDRDSAGRSPAGRTQGAASVTTTGA